MAHNFIVGEKHAVCELARENSKKLERGYFFHQTPLFFTHQDR